MDNHNKYIKYKNKYLNLKQSNDDSFIDPLLQKILQKYHRPFIAIINNQLNTLSDSAICKLNIHSDHYSNINKLLNSNKKYDIIYVNINNDNDAVYITNTHGNRTKQLIFRVPKKYDFNNFIRSIDYNNTDIYHNSRDDSYYYIVVNTKPWLRKLGSLS